MNIYKKINKRFKRRYKKLFIKENGENYLRADGMNYIADIADINGDKVLSVNVATKYDVTRVKPVVEELARAGAIDGVCLCASVGRFNLAAERLADDGWQDLTALRTGGAAVTESGDAEASAESPTVTDGATVAEAVAESAAADISNAESAVDASPVEPVTENAADAADTADAQTAVTPSAADTPEQPQAVTEVAATAAATPETPMAQAETAQATPETPQAATVTAEVTRTAQVTAQAAQAETVKPQTATPQAETAEPTPEYLRVYEKEYVRNHPHYKAICAEKDALIADLNAEIARLKEQVENERNAFHNAYDALTEKLTLIKTDAENLLSKF